MKKNKVTIICFVYNHEEFIAKTLDGFVTQETNFKFSVIVHDDASTDKSADIIRKYEKLYPDKIDGIYQKENQYSKNIDMDVKYIIPIVDSEYIAYCEGDDYWEDALKLQKQVDALDNNLDCEMCVHKVAEVDIKGNKNGQYYPNYEIEEGIIKSDKFLEMCESYSFHTSSYMLRTNSWLKFKTEDISFKNIASVGDEIMLLYFGQLGNVYYINESMSCYRRGVEGSWSSRIGNANNNVYVNHLVDMEKVISEFDKYSNYKYHDICCRRNGIYMFKEAIISKNYNKLLSNENKVIFETLSGNKRLFIKLGTIFPGLIRSIYRCRVEHLNKRHSR